VSRTLLIGCDAQLPDPDISRKHAQICYQLPPKAKGSTGDGVDDGGGRAGGTGVVTEGGRQARPGGEGRGEKVYCIRDLGSLNGTIINGTRISAEKKASEWTQLSGGDEVCVRGRERGREREGGTLGVFAFFFFCGTP
jgi:pSer/pThr/pTyr-binding forkhead associated (FHA) protein